jgi:hypothetical protein
LGVVFTQVEVLGEVVFPFEDLNRNIVVGGQELIARETQVSNIPTQRQNLQHSKDQEDPKSLQKSDEVTHKNKGSNSARFFSVDCECVPSFSEDFSTNVRNA